MNKSAIIYQTDLSMQVLYTEFIGLYIEKLECFFLKVYYVKYNTSYYTSI